mmetsp:Transcript_31416/g.73695  ORF Transcript_31416/g.73695 Transcript_31416/m.73695 type:complete len:128 (+) Transcript_31416:3-386(+)
MPEGRKKRGEATLDTTSTLFKRIGGERTVKSVVRRSFELILGDPLVNHIFAEHNTDKIQEKYVLFFTFALEGPYEYSGRPLSQVHQKLHLTNAHFDAVVGHVEQAMRELGQSAQNIEEVGEFLQRSC